MKRLLSILTIPFFVAACGGGGSGGGSSGSKITTPVTSTDTFQLQKAYVTYVNDSNSRAFNISGTADGDSLSGSGRATAGTLSAATFEGQSALSKTQLATGNIIRAGTSIPWSGSSIIYVDSAYKLLGINDGEEYIVVTSFSMLSDSAKVNATGSFYSANIYTNSTKSSVIGTRTATYALEPDTSSTALLKFSVVEKNTSGTTTSTATTVFRVTPSGGLTPISESSVTSTSILTLTY
jgi:hypothetical protein